MDRREFSSVSAALLAGLALLGISDSAFAKTSSKNPRRYSVVILGDNHFDTEPASVYHSFYMSLLNGSTGYSARSSPEMGRCGVKGAQDF